MLNRIKGFFLRKAVAFTGPSNSGKTSIIVKISEILIKDRNIAIIKNDPKDKARFDTEGKDSYKFSATGADVAVISPKKTTIFVKKEKPLQKIIDFFDDFELLLVEGLKTYPLPRIAIFRNKIDESYFNYSQAIAIDHTIDIKNYNIPKNIDVLDLNNPQMIIKWIDKNAKIV